MTLLGFVFIPIGLFAWFLRPSLLLPLTIIAAVFQAGAALDFKSVAISPYYFLALLVFTRVPLSLGTWKRGHPLALRLMVPLVSFASWSLLSAALMPLLFKGMPVLDSRLDTFSYTPVMTPLKWSVGNAIQSLWLVTNTGVVAFAATYGDFDSARKAFRIGCQIVLGVIILQLVLAHFGIVLPLWLFHSNSTQYMSMYGNGYYDRPNSVFSEPSVAGTLITGLALATLARFFDNGSLGLAVISITAVLVVRSTASLAAFASGFGALCVNRLPFARSSFYLSTARLRRWMLLLAALGGAAVIALGNAAITGAFASSTVDKSDSVSFLIRISADQVALQVFLQTWGLGVGLGTMRTSSLLASMLAGVGIIGTGLFVWFIAVLLRAAPSTYRWLLAGVLLAQVFGVPDLNLGVLWVTICVVLLAALRKDRVAIADSPQLEAPALST